MKNILIILILILFEHSYAQTSLSITSDTICAYETQQIICVATNPAPNVTYTWTNNLNALVVNNDTLIIDPVAIPAGNYTWTCNSQITNGASEDVPFQLVVKPTSLINNTSLDVCSGETFTLNPINGVNGIVPVGTTYSWSAPNMNGGITGGASGTNTFNISGTLFNSTNTTQIATYSISPTSGTCSGASFTLNINVKPKPLITTINNVVCSGANFSSSPSDGANGIVPAGTTYSWSAPNINGGITGGSSGTNASNISGTLSNSTNTPQTATYLITPKSGVCTGMPFSYIITVNPKPSISNLNVSSCSEIAFSTSPLNITDGIVPSGTTYSWVAPTVTGGMTGGTSGSSSNINGLLTNPTNTFQIATYSVIPTSGTCTGAVFTVIATIKPKPTISSMTNAVCSGANFSSSPSDGANGIVPVGTTYSWLLPTLTGGMTGGASGSAQTSIFGLLINSTNSNQTATYTVIPAAEGCVGTGFTLSVTVFSLPNVIANSDLVICEGQTANLSVSATQGMNYSWNTNEVGSTITVNSPGVYIVTGESSMTGCIDKDTVIVTLSIPQSEITNSGDAAFCEGSSVVLSVLFDPNSEYQWIRNGMTIPGAVGNQFQVNVSGLYSINVSDSLNCTGSDSILIQVNPLPDIPSINGNPTLCLNMLNQVYTTDETLNYLIWEVEGANIYSGQYTNELHINVTSTDTVNITLTEQDFNTGCFSSNELSVIVMTDYTAPEYVSVIPLGSQNDFLCAPGVADVIRWGKIRKTTNEITFYSTSNVYMDFDYIDTSIFYYFVDHGLNNECYTRSYYIYPEIVTSIDEINLIDLKLYPNPAISNLNIEINDSSPIELIIENMEGKVLIQTNFIHIISIPIQEWDSGIYFVKILSKNKTVNNKFFKI